MKFRTVHSFPVSQFQLDHKKSCLMMGSCFTENIGDKLRKYLYPCSINPFGVSYNPMSIHTNIAALLDKESYEENDLGLYKELYFSFDHYTKFSSTDKNQALLKMNTSLGEAQNLLKNMGFLIITFGTAYVYTYGDNNRIVNNCHKMPAKNFQRRLLSISEIAESYTELVNTLKERFPGVQVLFTLSPVRHLKDGFIENQRSKSILHLAIHEILKQHPETCSYFPAYEIMMDDLRDYRFYDEDLVHPNSQAISYLWDQFRDICISEQSRLIMEKLDPLIRDKAHRPMHINTKEYDNFLTKINERERKLKEEYPFLTWGILK